MSLNSPTPLATPKHPSTHFGRVSRNSTIPTSAALPINLPHSAMVHPRLGAGTFQYLALAATSGLMQLASLAYTSRQLGRSASKSSSFAFPATSRFGRLTRSAT
eukprot:8840850-Karenia_brevis.AAC.1